MRDNLEKGGGKTEQQNTQYWSLFEFSIFMRQIHTLYGDEIDSQRIVKHSIDAIFNEVSWIARFNFWTFFILFMIPLCIQMMVFD